MLMQVIHLRGLLFETADTEEINYRKRLRDAMLQSIGSSRFALYHHIVRRRIEPEMAAEHRDEFSQTLDDAWQARLATKRLYVNELFLTLIRRPLQGRVGGARPAARAASAAPPRATRRRDVAELRQLDAARDALLAALGSYGPRLLGVYQTPAGALLRAARIPLLALQWRDAARCCCRSRISAPTCPIAGSASGRRRSSSARPGRARAASSAWSRSRIIRGRPRPACSTSCFGCRSSWSSRRASASSSGSRRWGG